MYIIIFDNKIYKILFIFHLYLIYFYVLRNELINLTSKYLIKKFNSGVNTSDNGRIFLCTLYNNEAELAYILLWRLYDYIDRFIFVTSNMTYSGLPKNFTFGEFEKDIELYKDKLDIANFNNVCNRKEYVQDHFIWCMEMSQRDYAKTYIEEKYNPNEKDLLIVVDLDEILTREGIEYIKINPPKDFYFLKGAMYFPYYYHRVEDCDRSMVVRYNKTMRPISRIRFREIRDNNTLKYTYNPSKPLVTHCSYCFKNIDDYRNKLKSFSHQEYNNPPYITNNWIFKSHYCREKINSPTKSKDDDYEGWKHLIPDDIRLKYLIDRSFMYPLNSTNYTIKDLETLCDKTYNRTPFEPSTKYNT